MTIYYKSVRYINGKLRLIIEDECRNIVKNPTKEEIKIAIYEDKSVLKYRMCCKCGNNETRIDISGKSFWYSCRCHKVGCTRYICYYCYGNIGKPRPLKHKDTTCCTCDRKETYISKSGIVQWYTHRCDKENCTGYICNKCYTSMRNKLPDSYHNAIKSVANCRTGNLDTNTNTGRSIIDQAIVIRVIGGIDVNIKENNFMWPVDVEQWKYGKIDVKSSSLSRVTRTWTYHEYIYETWDFSTKRKVDCDTYILLGYDTDRKNICVVWIIPNDQDIIDSCSINIAKGSPRYHKFKVDPKPYNDAYHNLMIYIGNKKFFGIDDIKKWSAMIEYT